MSELLIQTPTFSLWRGDLLANTRLQFIGIDWASDAQPRRTGLSVAIQFVLFSPYSRARWSA